MCLLAFALNIDARYPLVVAANRDERHSRPALPAGWWEDLPDVLGGRDLAAGGTWLAVDRTGRLAAVTNFRDGSAPSAPRSRGRLVTDFLTAAHGTDAFLESLRAERDHYGPFSLVVLDGAQARYCSNRAPDAWFAPGIHALSNAALGDEWPKTAAARAGLEAWLRSGAPLEALFALLAQQRPELAPPEQYRSSLFLDGAEYGTRCSTIVAIDADRVLTFIERSFGPHGKALGEVRESIALRGGEAGSPARARG